MTDNVHRERNEGPWTVICGRCGREPDDFWHTCRFTDCRTPHPFCDFLPEIVAVEFVVVGEAEIDWPEGIFDS